MDKVTGGSQWKNKAGQKHYELNRQSYIDKQKRRIQGLYARLFEYKSDLRCKDCDVSDPRVIDFDHIGMDKSHNVSEMCHRGFSWESILREIAKCEAVCSNCHRIRTYNRVHL